jgi:hypothetical protein
VAHSYEPQVRGIGAETHLFVKFADGRSHGTFARMRMASGKVPVASEEFVGPLDQEHVVVSLKDDAHVDQGSLMGFRSVHSVSSRQ